MAEDNKLSWILDLDNTEFAKAITESVDSVKGLESALVNVAAVSSILAAAYYSVKTALDLTIEAEAVKQVEANFYSLAKMAGLAGNELKESLEKASGGLIENTDLLRSGTKAVVELGQAASRISEVMDLARQATSVFGGDLVQNFETFNQAISTGMTRSLKSNFGLIVDAEKAYKDFAAANGLAANALSQTAKQQALMNAVLEKGNEQFEGTVGGVKKVTNVWTQLKVTLKEMAEIATLAFEKLFGGTVLNGVTALKFQVDNLKNSMLETFGNSAEQATAKAERLQKQVSMLAFEIRAAQMKQSKFAEGSSDYAVMGSGIDKMKEKLAAYRIQLEEAEKASAKFKAESEAKDQATIEAGPKVKADTTGGGLVDKKAEADNELAFNRDMLAMRQQLIAQQQSLAQSAQLQNIDRLKQMELAEEQSAQKIQEINNSTNKNRQQKAEEVAQVEQNLEVQKLQMKMQMSQAEMSQANSLEEVARIHHDEQIVLEQNFQMQMAMIKGNADLTEVQKEQEMQDLKRANIAEQQFLEDQLQQQKLQALERYSREGTNAVDSFARGFESAAMRQSIAMGTFQAAGARAFGAFQTNAVAALTAWGSGSKSASEAARGFIFGMLGDVAIAEGTVLMMAGLPELNPLKVAGGAALVAFGGYLKSKANGPGVGMSAGGAGGGGGDSSMGSDKALTDPRSTSRDQQDQIQTKNVQIVVQGHYFENNESRVKMTELLQSSLDATDFSVRKIGGGNA